MWLHSFVMIYIEVGCMSVGRFGSPNLETHGAFRSMSHCLMIMYLVWQEHIVEFQGSSSSFIERKKTQNAFTDQFDRMAAKSTALMRRKLQWDYTTHNKTSSLLNNQAFYAPFSTSRYFFQVFQFGLKSTHLTDWATFLNTEPLPCNSLYYCAWILFAAYIPACQTMQPVPISVCL